MPEKTCPRITFMYAIAIPPFVRGALAHKKVLHSRDCTHTHMRKWQLGDNHKNTKHIFMAFG
jgi:hypothetical protein